MNPTNTTFVTHVNNKYLKSFTYLLELVERGSIFITESDTHTDKFALYVRDDIKTEVFWTWYDCAIIYGSELGYLRKNILGAATHEN